MSGYKKQSGVVFYSIASDEESSLYWMVYYPKRLGDI